MQLYAAQPDRQDADLQTSYMINKKAAYSASAQNAARSEGNGYKWLDGRESLITFLYNNTVITTRWTRTFVFRCKIAIKKPTQIQWR